MRQAAAQGLFGGGGARPGVQVEDGEHGGQTDALRRATWTPTSVKAQRWTQEESDSGFHSSLEKDKQRFTGSRKVNIKQRSPQEWK